MEKIYVLGLGPGNPDYILPAVKKIISDSDIVIGGKRNVESINDCLSDQEIKYIDSKLSELVEHMKLNRDKKISVIVSGDPGFYSMLNYLKKNFTDEELDVIPGISSMQYMFSRLTMYWYDAFISSLHGKEFDFIEVLKNYNKVGVLTDNKYTPQVIAERLKENKFDNVKIYVGENLSYENEVIRKFEVDELCSCDHKFEINVVVIERD